MSMNLYNYLGRIRAIRENFLRLPVATEQKTALYEQIVAFENLIIQQTIEYQNSAQYQLDFNKERQENA